MKKIMRIALVFALAGATLVGCTKDYSGDISDLNKKASEQQTAITALQSAVSNAQTAADAAAATANSALSLAKAAATAEELDAVKATLAKAATAEELKAVDAKYAAYIPAIEAAAKAADLEEFKTLVAEEIAKLATKEEVAAFKAAYDEMVVALQAADTENAEEIAALKAACETKFAALDDADSANAEAIVALEEALAAAIEEGKAADKQNADAIDALEETTAAAIAATNVRIDDVVAALDTHKTEFTAAVARIVDLETKYIALEARVLALEAVDEELKVLIAENKAGIETNAAAIAALETKLNGLIDKVYEDVWTINAPAAVVEVNYISTHFDPATNGNTDTYKALAKAFPELKDIEKTDLSFGGSVPFAVNPDTFTFDSTFTFKFFDAQGKEFPATLSNPVKGLDSTLTVTAGKITTAPKTKAAVGGYWTLSFAPVKSTKTSSKVFDGLSLVATKGEQVAATEFAYKANMKDGSQPVEITLIPKRELDGDEYGFETKKEYWVEYADEIVLVDSVVTFNDALFDGKYIIAAETTDAKTILAVEEYGIEFPAAGTDGIVIKNYPEGRSFIEFVVNVKALGYNGSTDEKHFTLRVVKKANVGTLEAKTVTYTDSTETVKLRWNLSDYMKTAAGKKAFFEADYQTLVFENTKDAVVAVVYNKNKEEASNNGFHFYDAAGKEVDFAEDAWAKAETFGFDINNDEYNPFIPGEYNVYFLVNNPGVVSTVENFENVIKWREPEIVEVHHRWITIWVEKEFKYYTSEYIAPEAGNVVFAAEGTLTVKNDEALAPVNIMSLLPEVCKDGVVQAVGTADGTTINYSFEENEVIVLDKAFPKSAKIVGYVDVDLYKADSTNWLPNKNTLIEVPVANKYVENKTVRNLAVKVQYFGNENNVAYFPFQLTILSAVENGVKFATKDPEIAFGEVAYPIGKVNNSVKVDNLFKSLENVTITNGKGKGNTYSIAKAIDYDLINSVTVTLKEDELATADRFLVKNGDKFEWRVGDSIQALAKYTGADIPEGYVLIDAEIKVVDNWGLVTTHDFTIKVWAKKQ